MKQKEAERGQDAPLVLDTAGLKKRTLNLAPEMHAGEPQTWGCKDQREVPKTESTIQAPAELSMTRNSQIYQTNQPKTRWREEEQGHPQKKETIFTTERRTREKEFPSTILMKSGA